jgi:hypothetical protein
VDRYCGSAWGETYLGPFSDAAQAEAMRTAVEGALGEATVTLAVLS